MSQSPIMLVTGGSRGIGAAICLLAAQRGYDVCVNYTQAVERAEAVADQVRSHGQRAIAVQAGRVQARSYRTFVCRDRP